LTAYCQRLPNIGETLKGQKFKVGFGGKGANQAVQAAKLGSPVIMITKVGDDVFGRDTIRNFQEHGIDSSHVLVTKEASSGVAPIIIDAEGSNAIIIVGGANDLLTKEEIRDAKSKFISSRIVMCQLEIPLEISLEALRVAKESNPNVLTILNTAPVPPSGSLPDELYSFTDLLCLNEPEAEALTKTSVKTIESAEKAARLLLERGPKEIIITLGSRGSLYVSKETSVHVPVADDEIKVVDTSGAGDSFLGALAHFLLQGQDMKQAIKKANKVAGVSITAEGTQSSFPSKTDFGPDFFD